ncbi:LytTR family DNA-binding domain-containing protein [Roseibium polysiphoniae]|uniref:LytTR family DNA-binding domain-containing protein n=1 Tax=Roseibium polysiphoniae TaxID=2571221 RepID=UPI001BCF242B|nr:LytTR family DNA-binding domain-containing protein [Roseibium polysiphoniae]
MVPLPLKELSILSGLSAVLIAATQIAVPDGWHLLGAYGYWLVRIALEAALFIGSLQIAVQIAGVQRHRFVLVLATSLATLAPFVLATTAMDIILGLPELERLPMVGVPFEGEGNAHPVGDRLVVFVYELGFLLDNHLALCLLITAPWILRQGAETEDSAAEASSEGREETRPHGSGHVSASIPAEDQGASEEVTSPPATPFLQQLEPAFETRLLRAEAQEHYVRLIGEAETRMILFRFADLMKLLPEEMGSQVHRSHWVAHDGVEHCYRDGSNLRLKMKDGSTVPVSRSNATSAMERFGTSS